MQPGAQGSRVAPSTPVSQIAPYSFRGKPQAILRHRPGIRQPPARNHAEAPLLDGCQGFGANEYSGRRRDRFLFESRQRTKFSARRVQQIVSEYAAAAELPEHVHPHLLRHQMLTWLTAQGLPDVQIQLISGHASKKSLEVYQHLSLAQVEAGYQRAVKQLEF
jgi:integrase